MSFDKSKKPLLNKAAFCFAYIKNIYGFAKTNKSMQYPYFYYDRFCFTYIVQCGIKMLRTVLKTVNADYINKIFLFF